MYVCFYLTGVPVSLPTAAASMSPGPPDKAMASLTPPGLALTPPTVTPPLLIDGVTRMNYATAFQLRLGSKMRWHWMVGKY